MGNKGDATREYIKEKAYTLFAEKGFKDVTMKDVCEVTGLSRGGLYRHFDSTAQIFEEIFLELTGKTEQDFAERIDAGENARQMLEDILEKYKEEIEEKERTLTLAIYEYSQAVNSEFLIELNRTSKVKWKEFIKYGVDQGEFVDVEIDAVVDLILYAYQGARMWSKILPVDRGVSRHIVDCIYGMLLEKGEKKEE
ncbi:TetR/AcrR family transcriptional regulator [Roseburia hominis]